MLYCRRQASAQEEKKNKYFNFAIDLDFVLFFWKGPFSYLYHDQQWPVCV